VRPPAPATKVTGEPDVNHCERVARTVAAYTSEEAVVAAAVFHDTVEDTDVTVSEIEATFGSRVAKLFGEVTNVSRPEDGNYEIRQRLDREHLAQSSSEGATIKLADLIDNTSSIVRYDAEYARSYPRGKELLLEVFKHGNAELWTRAYETLQEAQRNKRHRRPLHAAMDATFWTGQGQGRKGGDHLRWAHL
jgi:(p)ppGpp synthase/HD superfamily hydrolase